MIKYSAGDNSLSIRAILLTGLALAVVILLALTGCVVLQRRALYYPTHRSGFNGLTPWNIDGSLVGCAREVAEPRTVWLMLHGNGGQAADRQYALPRFSDQDSVYILEYPGYGLRAGRPTPETINAAAVDAYHSLRRQYPQKPVAVVGESLGTGPACLLARESRPPDKLVLLNPYESIAAVAEAHASVLPSRLVFRGTWDNAATLAGYQGPVAIFSAENDSFIPPGQGRALATLLPQASFTLVPGGHNDWPRQSAVKIRFP